jgi:hypothetical protein
MAMVPVVHAGEVAFHQVADNAAFAGLVHLAWNLRAGGERRARQCNAALPARRLELQLAVGTRQHDEAALGFRDVERGVEHQREDLFEHPPRSERAQAVENRRHLPEVGIRSDVAQSRNVRARAAIGHEHQLDGVGPAQANAVTVLEGALQSPARR